MNCPNCQTENAGEAKFCMNCGARLALTCPVCGQESPPSAKFCSNCGHQFGAVAAAAAGGAAARDAFMPQEMAAKLEEARRAGAMSGERRVVTMLFCDVVGSTAASEQLDPEEWTEIMNGLFEQMIAPVYHYEGSVGRLMGDAVLAFFGAPIAHEDDPQRAVLAGLDIINGVQAYRRQARKQWDVDVDVRVGINTGLVVVGAVGSDLRLEYTAMGDAINLAARMEQTAAPGTLQVAEATYRQVAPFFEVEALGGIAVKGKRKPVPSYRVLSRRAEAGRLRGIEGLAAPLIGRGQERARLEQTLAQLEKGIGGIACLVGEAGLGKSRLIREMRATAEGLAPPVGWVETASLSYESGQPYALFQRLSRRLLAAAPGESAASMRERIAALVATLETGSEEAADWQRVFESLFGLPGAAGEPPLAGEAFKGQLFNVMAALWRQQASRQPVVLVCDDLHWSDPASIELLLHLFPLTDEASLLIVCALRPETRAPGWRAKQAAEANFPHRFTEVALRPLSRQDSGQLVDSLLPVADLPPALRARIEEKTEGNPFFLEEVARSLIDSGVVVREAGGARWRATSSGQEIEIPGNVQSLLMARIDRLQEDARHTLQLAAVIDRSFYSRVLARLAALAAELDAQLLALQRAELIVEAARQPELEYIFRHALTQEAAYNTILRKQRREFHQQVAESIEALFPEQTEEMAGSLARHFFEARQFERALAYYTLAGDGAFRLHAAAEAAGHYAQAIACAGQVEAGSEQLVHLYSRRGRAYEFQNEFEAALENYQEMVTVAAEREDKALELASLAAQCIVRATQTPLYDPPRARQLGEAALALARELGDEATEAKVLWGMLLVEAWGGGDNERALAYGQRSLAIARELDLKEQMGYTLTNLVNVDWNLDQLAAARQANLEARAVWQEAGNMPMLADSYSMSHTVHMLAGEFDAVLATAAEGLRISQAIGNVWNQMTAYNARSQAYWWLGDFGQALASLREGQRLAEQVGHASMLSLLRQIALRVYLSAGHLERAEEVAGALYAGRDTIVMMFLAGALALVANVKIEKGELEEAGQIIAEAYAGARVEAAPIFIAGVLFLAEARLALAQGRPEQALAGLQALAKRARQASAASLLLEVNVWQAKALLAQGRPRPARERLLAARAQSDEFGERRLRWQILALLAELEEQEGSADAAAALRDEARQVVAYMANHMGDEALRASFLARADVRRPG